MMRRLTVRAIRSISNWHWWSEWTSAEILMRACNLDDRWGTGVFEWVEVTSRQGPQA